MVIDISAVVKVAGAELKINESGIIEDLSDVYGVISVAGPVAFNGVVANLDGLLHLEGDAVCTYNTRCDYCNKQITRELRVRISEDLVEEQSDREEDQYTYVGNWLHLDKILSDNIALAMPMHHRCSENCHIICQKCGEPVTGKGCGCKQDQPIDPRLAALKDFMDKKHTDTAD